MDTYLVGGAVRDQLLGLPVEERDWVVVGATAEAMRELGYRQVGRDFPVFLHPDTAEEYALARTERKSGRGHHGFEVHSDPEVTLEEDLRRRDLTINAMALEDDGTLIDPYGGAADIEARVLRHVSPAFAEDPLRVLRVARFAARLGPLGFTLHPSTLALMRNMTAGGELDTLPRERIWVEFEKALAAPAPARFIDTLEQCGAAEWLLPGLPDINAACSRLTVAASASTSPELRFAVLFYGISAGTAEAVCRKLQPPRRFREPAALLAALSDSLPRVACLPAEARLALLEQADAFRRPERFDLLLRCCEALLPGGADIAACWRHNLAAGQDIETRSLAELGLKGQAAGTHIRSLRKAALQALDR
jgi:tRNA nucleotidyltransferase (CCA-adding enzyme)